MPAYVLLGDPGAGKTTAFRTECEALGGDAICITARDFTTFDPNDHPEWRNKTLFIDGLDEVRAGTSDARMPFDEVRSRLDKLGRPRFRLSCRVAYWLGDNDHEHLSSIAPQGSHVALLQLNPLTESDIIHILASRKEISDPRRFIVTARDRAVESLLQNPLTLRMLADVVARDENGWPATQLALFERACSLLSTESNQEHRIADCTSRPADLLDAAGRLCAVLLISGAVGYTLAPHSASDDYLDPYKCGYDQPHHTVPNAIATRLFTADSDHRIAPLHRRIAEFVGAHHLTRIIGEGLPARRVIALMTGKDGTVVTHLRGLIFLARSSFRRSPTSPHRPRPHRLRTLRRHIDVLTREQTGPTRLTQELPRPSTVTALFCHRKGRCFPTPRYT